MGVAAAGSHAPTDIATRCRARSSAVCRASAQRQPLTRKQRQRQRHQRTIQTNQRIQAVQRIQPIQRILPNQWSHHILRPRTRPRKGALRIFQRTNQRTNQRNLVRLWLLPEGPGGSKAKARGATPRAWLLVVHPVKELRTPLRRVGALRQEMEMVRTPSQWNSDAPLAPVH